VVDMLKKVLPDITIILGGPEVSYEPMRVDFKSADFIIRGEGEIAFYELCKELLQNKKQKNRIIYAKLPEVKSLKLPYDYYSDEDIKNRYVYFEASRGCPFKCEFCLSSIDKSVRYFDKEVIFNEIEKLWQRGVRNFKFVDRTFNLNIKFAKQMIEYFLNKDEKYMVHFEVIPDNFPKPLKNSISKFPPKSLQLEIGLQTLNPKILENISRSMDIKKVKENIAFLNSTTAHMHLDLIIGLPGESIESFANNLNTLTKLTDSEIQLGILKKLSGVAISRHDKEQGMIYDDTPPYEILQNNLISYLQMQELKRFARFWDMVYNSGNFLKSSKLILNESAFENFLDFSRWIYQKTKSTWKISLNRLGEYIFEYLQEKGFEKTFIADILMEDLTRAEGRKAPSFLKPYASFIPKFKEKNSSNFAKRQNLRDS
jgi:hypothetical protein